MARDRIPEGMNLESLAQVLRRRWWVIAVCAVLVPFAALAVSMLQPSRYSATASLLFRDPGLDRTLFGSPFFTPTADPAREAATNVRLVSLQAVAERTARRLDGPLDAEAIASRVSVSDQGPSNVVGVTATDTDPRRAARIADAFAREFISFRRQADQSKVREAQRLVQRRIANLELARDRTQLKPLRERAEQLEVLASLQTGNAELVQSAVVPGSPSSPKPLRNGLLGAIAGLLLGLGLALLFERFDRRLKDQQEIEDAYALPVLGVVPESEGMSGGDGTAELTRADSEAFRTLRANLKYFNVAREVRSVAVTSAMPAEGKTTVAWNLALATATKGLRTLLIEADLRRPGIATRLAAQGRRGLSTLLVADVELNDVATDVVLDYDYGVADFDLDLLTSGPLPPNPADLLESERMRSILEEAHERYDFVVVDTPPLSLVADAIPLMRQVSGTIVVARLGATTRDAAAELRKHVSHLDADILGLVVNWAERPSDYYGYASYADLSTNSGVRVRVPSE